MNAVQQEYAVVFPEYYFGQIFEAQHQPGTVAYSLSLQLTLLQETVKEMARNGCKKVVIVNGHGGNDSLLPLFAQAQLATPRDYVVYVFGLPERNVPGRPAVKTTARTTCTPARRETSNMLVARPDLVHLDRAAQRVGRRPEPPEPAARTSTPASGGTRSSPITTRATARPPPKSSASSTEDVVEADRRGHARPSRPTRKA